jgi:hypothetical protein
VAVTALSFATPADLNNFLGATIDTDRAQQVLNQSTALIQGWCRQNLFAVSGDTVTVDPYDTGECFLPELPVTAVTQVQLLGCDGTWSTLDPSFYRWNSRGKVYLTRRPDFWPWQYDSVQVTYDHGYTTIPADLQGVCLQLAGRLFSNPYDAQGLVTGGIQMRFSGTRGTDGLKDTEIAILGKYTLVEVS